MKLDITKPVRTVEGKRVVGLCRIPKNSCGAGVTYPLKGSVVVSENPLKMEYDVWSDEGVWDVVCGRCAERNLVNGEVERIGNKQGKAGRL